jgi:hypothetical protein
MRGLTWIIGAVIALPLAASLAINSRAETIPLEIGSKPAPVDYRVLYPQGEACVSHNDVNLNLNGRLTGPAVRRFLTPEALAAGVEIYITGSDENKFGNVSILYWQPKGQCVLWYETISVAEYSVRLGLTPYGVSPFYKKENN